MPLARRETTGIAADRRKGTFQAVVRGPATSIHSAAQSIKSSVPVVHNPLTSHEGVRQSLHSSHPTVSTGSQDLDRILLHGGLPLGSILLIEENGATDFSSILARSFASQGVVHGAMHSAPTQILTIGTHEHWSRELPGVHKEKHEAREEKLKKERSMVDQVTESANIPRSTNMKIAWRYGAQNTNVASPSNSSNLGKPHFIHTFDFTTRLTVPPKNISHIPAPIIDFGKALATIESNAKAFQAQSAVLRVVIPSLLHPAVYHPSVTDSAVKFLHSLQNLCAKYSTTICIFISLNTSLYTRDSFVTSWIEHLCNGVIELDPKPELFEKVKDGRPSSQNSSEANKPYQGFVNIYKLPLFSDRGSMMVRSAEHVFRVGKRNFEISEWGIPVEEEEEKKDPLEF